MEPGDVVVGRNESKLKERRVPVLNHHIVASSDSEASSLFMAELMGLERPVKLGPFAVVKVSNDTTLDFVTTQDPIHSQHYAFLVTEEEFDQIFQRLRDRKLAYWSDPLREDRGSINHWDDGRGVYFDDPDGHLLEIFTRPYGSGGTEAQHPHPLIAPRLQAPSDE